jgi:hypothetical protein
MPGFVRHLIPPPTLYARSRGIESVDVMLASAGGGSMRSVAAVLLTATVAACGGAPLPEIPDRSLASYRDHVEPMVLKRCVDCHTVEDPKAGLVLEEGLGFERMVGRPARQAPELALVSPGELEASYLWLKLDQRPIKGEGMPRTLTGAKPLPKRELERFRRWIEDGAHP